MADVFLSFLKISLSTGLIVAVLILLSPFLNKRYASKWKYRIWMFLAVWLIIPFSGVAGRPMVDLSQPGNQNTLLSGKSGMDPQIGQTVRSGQIVVELPAQVLTPISPQVTESNISFTWLDIMAFVWALGSLLILSVHLSSYLYCKRQILKRGVWINDTRILCQVFELKQELHIKGNIPVVKVPDAASPMIIGFVKPLLVLPDEQYTAEELFFILKHELVHYKRKDVYAKFILTVANALHWFNPIIWIMQKEAVVDMELSCDERVTQGVDYAVRKAYTETLLSTLHKSAVGRTVLTTQFYGGKQIMKKRFRNILNGTGKKNGAVILIGATLLTISLGTLIGCSVAHEKMEDTTNNRENNSLPDDTPVVTTGPQDGQIYGYMTKLNSASATIDRQLWVTSDSEDWKPEYNDAAGFEVVDAEGEDITYPLSEDCKYSILENHWYPVVELDKKEFESSLSEMEYPVLWVIQLSDGQIVEIGEQYRP